MLILISTKGELDAFYAKEGHQWDNKEWEDRVWEIIKRGLPNIDSLKCEDIACKKTVWKFRYNMAGEIHYIYCKKHWNEIMPHVKFFSV